MGLTHLPKQKRVKMNETNEALYYFEETVIILARMRWYERLLICLTIAFRPRWCIEEARKENTDKQSKGS